MIHLIVIMHFAAISLGAVTLSIAWMKYRDRQNVVERWMIITDLIFTINIILDAIRIYFSKNVASIPEYFWVILGIMIYLFSIITLYAAVALIANIIGKPLLSKLIPVFCLALIIPVIAHSTVPWVFDLLLMGCSLYVGTNLSLVSEKHRGTAITLLSALVLYWLVFTVTNLLPGMPQWISKIPYTQVIYLGVNLLGLGYFLSGAPNEQAGSEGTENLESLGNTFGLTERELDIVREIIAGKNNREIGEQLFISPNTVKNHVYNIYRKTGIKNRYQLIVHFSPNRSNPL